MPDHDRELTQAGIARFWAPLAATWLMMAVEGPFLAALVARRPHPELNLAAYGVAYAFALVAEAPVIMMMSAAVAVAKDRPSYLALRRFATVLNVAITLVLLTLVLPPVATAVLEGLVGLPPEVAARAHRALVVLLPWPAAIGIRRLAQGVLIRAGLTRRVAWGTLVRLCAMSGTAVALFAFGRVEGASLGAAALSAGVVAEMTAALAMARPVIRELAPDPIARPPGWRDLTVFYWPLAMTSLLALGVQPVVTFLVGHSREAVASLAVLPVVYSLVFLFRALGLAFQEVAIALAGDRLEGYRPLARFASVLGTGVAVGLGMIVWTPLAGIWFRDVAGLSPELVRIALPAARILALMPSLTVLLSWQRALLVHLRATGPVTWATATEVVVVVLVLRAAAGSLGLVGASAAAVGLLAGRLAANAVLVVPVRRSLSRRLASAEGAAS
jgi:hypothetical protein